MNAQQIADRIVNKSGSYQEVMSYAEGMISPLITRAEAAEARIAILEHDLEVDDWHGAFLHENKRVAQLEAERDDLFAKLE